MRKHAIVVGGGFGGLNLIMQLQNRSEFDVTLVDVNNYNFFPPLLYQVATGFLEPSAISYPFRKFLRGKTNIRFRMGELQKIIPEENKIVLADGELSYDYLILATGAETNYFGMSNVKRFAIPMKNISDALSMRNTILRNLEEAARETNPAEKQKWLTFVIAGAGATGVEVSGMFAEMRKHIFAKDYPEFDSTQTKIILVDGGKNVLAAMTGESQKYSEKVLNELGIEIRLNTTVKDYDGDTLAFADGSSISTKTVIWSAGVSAKTFDGLPAQWYGKGKRLLVDGYNMVNDAQNIFAIGDTCLQTADIAFPNGHPQLAQVAIQQGENLGKNLLLSKEKWVPFRYKDKGSMAIIGTNKAVADIPKPKLHIDGFMAWLAWLFVHVVSLLNYRNRLRTLYNWVGAYFNKDQSFRMIIEPSEKIAAN